MTGKQVLDAFSETLMQDERILSPRERELLTSILQNSRTISDSNPETRSAVTKTIARSVGETVAQRAFALLGGTIVEQILLGHPGVSAGTESAVIGETVELRSPQPPAGSPQPPAPSPVPPGSPQPPAGSPQPPAGSPQPPSLRFPTDTAKLSRDPLGARSFIGRAGGLPAGKGEASNLDVLEPPAVVRAQCVVLDEFLTPQELDELVNFTLLHEREFQNSEVISPSGEPGVVDYSHRRSRVLMEMGKHRDIIVERMQGVLPRVMAQLELEEFPVRHVETQITASNDGDFFGVHSDDAQEMIASRRLTFVYFFHREPRAFAGGELRLHDSRWIAEQQIKAGSYESIVPRQNQMVFFPCSLLHEITAVECPSRAFADSRFTVNGWLHK
jgi:Rps23 Pro-64 3,4-dihydroxylase Tpa1-like proline 4-hydroxylase